MDSIRTMGTAPRMRTATISVDGIRSPLIEAGPADATEAVVFVHGNPGSTRDWEGLVVSVGMFARAIAFDVPGFGAADKPAGFDYSVPGYARHLGHLLDSLNVRREVFPRAKIVILDDSGHWPFADNPQAVAA